MTHIEKYFIKNTLLTIPSDSSATYSLCCVLKSSNLITLPSFSIIHSLCCEPISKNWIIDVSVTIKCFPSKHLNVINKGEVSLYS